ncbi:MAG: hypothetical protein KGQ79_08980, partial [Proteobacteria bacterium]|nr:hypothetical protein [Pseudomonadota bacterium]
KIMLGHRGPSIATDCHQFIAAPGVAPNSAAYRSALPARHFRIGSVQAAPFPAQLPDCFTPWDMPDYPR